MENHFSSPLTVQGGSMRSSSFQIQLRVIIVILAACFAVAVARAQNPTHILTGTIEKVDAAAKTIAVKTADGTVETVKFTEKTTVHGLKDAAKGADLAGKEGGHVIVDTGKTVGRYSVLGAKKGEHVTVYYTEEAGKKIAHVFKHL